MSPPTIPSSTTFGASPPNPSSRPPHTPAVPEDLQLALEALQNLTTCCPDWASRLDELSGQIDQRQLDLARLAEQQSQRRRPISSNNSPRNRASTESLKPRDDGEAHPGADRDHVVVLLEETDAVQHPDDKRASAVTDGISAHAQKESTVSNIEVSSPTSSAVERQTSQVVATASANARANLRRSQLYQKRASAAESLLTRDGAVANKYRNRDLVIVYYDSYVQSFFEEAVKFVSASRNFMRKAKMAAKVAQIKRMAELETPDDEESGFDDGLSTGNGFASFTAPRQPPSGLQPDGPFGGTLGTNGNEGNVAVGEMNGARQPIAAAEPDKVGTTGMLAAINHSQLSYTRAGGNGTGIASDSDLSPSRPKLSTPFRPPMGWSSSFSTYGAGSHPRQPPDALDELDKGLEALQSMCEHAAHQFLREGDCADDIVKIKERLAGIKASADKELERRLADDEDGSLKKLLADGPAKSRTYRPQSMRRDASLAGATARLKTSVAGSVTSGAHGVGGVANAIPAASAGADSKAVAALCAGGGFDATMIEVDEGNGDVDVDASAKIPKFQFQSTRAMGPRAATSS